MTASETPPVEHDVAGPRHPTVQELRDAAGPASDTRRRLVERWSSILGPPVAWGIQLFLSDMVSELGCRAGGFAAQRWVLIAITLAAAAVSVVAGLLALRDLRQVREDPDERPTPRERTEFMAEAGIVSSAIFTLLILLGGIVPHLILRVCGS